jgi:hypothetical protein
MLKRIYTLTKMATWQNRQFWACTHALQLTGFAATNMILQWHLEAPTCRPMKQVQCVIPLIRTCSFDWLWCIRFKNLGQQTCHTFNLVPPLLSCMFWKPLRSVRCTNFWPHEGRQHVIPLIYVWSFGQGPISTNLLTPCFVSVPRHGTFLHVGLASCKNKNLPCTWPLLAFNHYHHSKEHIHISR